MATLDYYNSNAKKFAESTTNVDFKEVQNRFLSFLKPGASILDFGCGSGRDTRYFHELGYQVEATDGSEELVKLATEYSGVQVKCQLFQELDEVEKYDGIWACSSILHLPKQELKDVLRKMVRALKADGIIYTSFKYGSFEGERNGRYFTDFTLKDFHKFLWMVEEAMQEDEKLRDSKKNNIRKTIRIKDHWITGDVRPGRESEQWLNLILKKGTTKVMAEDGFYQEFEKLVAKAGVSSVVILGHMNPDGDSVGSVFGLSHYLKVAYPELKIYPYMPTVTEKGPKMFIEEDQVFKADKLPEDPYIVICCDTAIKERAITEEVLEGAEASMGIDHHRSNEYYCDVNYVEFAESCAELIFSLLRKGLKDDVTFKQFLSQGPKPSACDFIYLGILHDTAVFTRACASTFQAASVLIECGVDHRDVMRSWETQTLKELLKQNKLISEAVTVADGKIAYLVKTYDQSQQEGIVYDDIHHISNYIRNCADVVAAFTMYEQEPGFWRCSLRSDGVIVDANEVFGRFGGGGHKGAAGLRIKIGDAMKIKEDLLKILTEKVMA